MSADYVVHGLTLTLGWFLSVNVVLGIAAAAIAAATASRADRHSAQFWMMLRLAPALVSSAFVIALFVPSYWAFEPREAVEGFDATLALVGLCGAALVAASAARAIAAWRSASRRIQNWMRHSTPMTVAGTALPAFAVDADQPVIALVGVFRPRLLITRGLIDALTTAELEAAVAHELGHQRAFDNLKRLAMRSAPDLLTFSRWARAIEERWAAAAEHAADRIGDANSVAARCALASALVKVARLTPPLVPVAEPISSLISGGDIASRVQRLLNEDAGAQIHQRGGRRVATIAGAVLAGALAAYGPILHSVHDATEFIVRVVP